mmetsp:Transcript_12504/g.37538  ORF Transcript_12504/g.37538 Transcript_12504/m.37538 type:complete len:338 (+) Transcript_12504:479-1492(+)
MAWMVRTCWTSRARRARRMRSRTWSWTGRLPRSLRGEASPVSPSASSTRARSSRWARLPARTGCTQWGSVSQRGSWSPRWAACAALSACCPWEEAPGAGGRWRPCPSARRRGTHSPRARARLCSLAPSRLSCTRPGRTWKARPRICGPSSSPCAACPALAHTMGAHSRPLHTSSALSCKLALRHLRHPSHRTHRLRLHYQRLALLPLSPDLPRGRTAPQRARQRWLPTPPPRVPSRRPQPALRSTRQVERACPLLAGRWRQKRQRPRSPRGPPQRAQRRAVPPVARRWPARGGRTRPRPACGPAGSLLRPPVVPRPSAQGQTGRKRMRSRPAHARGR